MGVAWLKMAADMGLLLLLPLVYLALLSSALPSHDPLSPALHYYEKLHKDNVRHKIVRDNMPRLEDNLIELHLDIHSKYFRLQLSPTIESFHPSLQSQSSHPINFSEFFHGHVFGAEFSDVTAHMTEDGIMTAIIVLDIETYYVEPSSRHIKESHDYHMITYKASDIKYNMTGDANSPFCGHKGAYKVNHTHYVNFGKTPSKVRSRLKRQAPSPVTVCPMFLVGSTSFYEQFGGGEVEKAINYLLLLMLDVNRIYRTTDWFIPNVVDSATPGTKGLQIAGVNIINDANNAPAYNQDSNVMSENLLREFSRTDWSRYCLAHLFIGSNFADNSRLGVAYIADASSFYLGGVCSRRTSINGVAFSGNTGISSFRARSRLLLLAEAVIITAHEIGHNWGAQHDDSSSSECSPSPENGGKYLMYPIAQDGTADNNNVFSPCSVRGVSRVLNTHESDCFTAPSNNLCGNFIVDVGEQCDPGPTGVLSGGDMCCTVGCRYKGNATHTYTCSDTNHECCQGCFISREGSICLLRQYGNLGCLANETCNGMDKTCPSSVTSAPVDTPCGFEGICVPTADPNDDVNKTECRQFCEQMDLETCHCTGEDQCKICCRDGSGACSRINNPSMDLPDGSFCEGGSCQQGTCVLSDPDLVTFLSDLFGNFSTNALLQFLYENIVGSVIVVSLFVWIPVSTAVHVFDIWWEKRREKKKKKKKQKDDEKKLVESVDYDSDDPDNPKEIEEVTEERKFRDNKDPEKDPITHHLLDKETVIN
ncbi:PREDICTED: ADAM 17-like protease [Amphimedon queenslandica]|uniref:Peptidase M12B domain-containing protein n=1 Tax=Amphimedon queenslandica TaxID=400682 RepID=A0A1X7VBP5_AMPQE|nr:PREDICTED: ADAM 17-like protease [Amphimedon queenslandica]|eukprot:XP_019849541.1 PREDICTED: ADAM 17-like protease [Amphimedon queenslandica]